GQSFSAFSFSWEWPNKRYNKRQPLSCALPRLNGAGNLERFQVYERGLSYEKASVPSGNRGGTRRHQPRQKERSAPPADLSDFDLRGHRPAGAGARHSYRQLLHTLRQSHAYGRRECHRRTGRHGRGAVVLFRHGRDHHFDSLAGEGGRPYRGAARYLRRRDQVLVAVAAEAGDRNDVRRYQRYGTA